MPLKEEIYVVTSLYTNRLKITGLFVCFFENMYTLLLSCMYGCISSVHNTIKFVYIIITEKHIKYL